MNSVFIGVKFVLGLLSVKVVSFFLGASGMAITSHLKDFASMFKSFSTLGLNNTIIKSYKDTQDDNKKLSEVMSSYFWSYVILSGIIGLLIVIFSKPINWFLFGNYEYNLIIKLIGLLLPFCFMHLFLKALLNSLELFKSIIWMQIISSVAAFIMTFLLIYYYGLLGGIIAIAILDLIVFAVVVIFVMKKSSYFNLKLFNRIKKKDLNILRKYALMALVTSIVMPMTLILIRNNIISNENVFQAGIWDSSKRISNFYMMFVTSGLSLYYVPKIASINSDRSLKIEIKQYYTTLMPIFLLGLVAVFLLKDVIIKLALTEEFIDVRHIIIWQIIGDFIKVGALAFGFILSVRAMVFKYIFIELIFNGCYYLLATQLLKSHGIEGVVLGYMLSNFVSLIFMFWFFRKLIFSKLKSDSK